MQIKTNLSNEEIEIFKNEAIENLEYCQNLFLKYEKENLSQEELNDLKRRLHNVKGHSKFLNINIASETAHIIENIIEDIIKSIYKKEEIIDLLIEANSTLLEFYNSFNIINDSIVTSNDSIEIFMEKLRLFKKKDTNNKTTEDEKHNISSAQKEVPKSIMDTTSQIPEIIIKKDYPKYDYKSVDEEIIYDFLNEANEMISTISLDVLALEKNKDIDLLNKIFRVLHTLKGSSGMIKLVSINYLAHSLEEILDMIRKNELVITSDIIDILLEGTEKIQNIISKIEKREEPNENVDAILTKIARIKNKQPIGKIPTSEPIKKEEKSEIEKVEAQQKIEPKKEEPKKEEPKKEEPKKEEAKKEEKKETAPQKIHSTQQSIRIDTANLETVMNQMGELIIEKIKLHSYVKEFLNYEMNLYKIKELIMEGQQNINDLTNKILEIIDHTTNHKEKLLVISEGFERLSNNLQNSILKMRLVAISQIFTRFPKVVRDLSKQLNKKINFKMSGEETKIDKNMIEKLIDPLIHIIRNSIDHGIEPEEIRIKKNKDPVGYIHLSAFYKGDNVIIQIEDDGAGINIQKVSEIALKKNLITKEMLDKMSREEIMLLIFQPGFSTAEKVTELSGRGVGMDVVKKTIEELNGTISIKSEEDAGTVISLLLPLTLAIMQILLIKILNYTLAIPLYLIKETVFCQKSDIYELSDKLVFNLRGEIVPLIILNDILNIPKSPLLNFADNNDSSIPIIIITVNEKKFGFIVDKLEGKQEIVLKNLGTLLNRVPFVSGATIMGDGSVVLILDIIAIISESNKYKFTKLIDNIKEETKTNIIKKNALVVDDAMAIRAYLKKQLLEFGFEVDEAENGKVALLKAKDKKYDLFTIDFLMPEMDGYELISNLRNTDNYKKTPIIAISSKGENVDKIKGFELGVDEYIVKPIDKEIFTGIIKKYFF